MAKTNDALKQTLDTLATEPELERFLGHVLKAIAAQFDASIAEYWWTGENNMTYPRLIAWGGQIFTPEELDHPCIEGLLVPSAMVHGESLYHRRKHFIIDDYATSPFVPQHIADWYISRGIHKEINVPMLLRDESFGALIVRLSGAQQITQEQVELAYALANQASLAVQVTRLAEQANQAAIAREQEKAAQERAKELAKANESLQASLSKLADEPELQKFLGHVLTVCTERLGALGAGIWQYEGEIGYLLASYENGKVNLPPETCHPNAICSLEQMIEDSNVRAQLTKGKIVVHYEEDFQNISIYKPYRVNFQQRGIKSLLLTPISLGKSLQGTLVLRFDHRCILKIEEVELARALANQAALAIEVTRLAEATKQAAIAREQEKAAQERAKEREQAARERVVELTNVNIILKRSLSRLALEPNLDSFLGQVLLEVTSQVSAIAAHVFLLDTNTNTLETRVSVKDGQIYMGATADNPELFRTPFEADITPLFEHLCRTRQICTLSVDEFDGIAWPGLVEWLRRMGYREAACIALVAGEQPIGKLGLCFREKIALKPEELELIHALANQATLAIQLTRLAEQAGYSAVLAERNRMAREIHDTLAQAFTGILMHQQAAKRLLMAEQEDVREHIDWTLTLAREGLQEARRSVCALRSAPSGGDKNLSGMLTRLMEQMTSGLPVEARFSLRGTPCSLPEDVESNLLRIGQEALTNALRHASPNRICIELIFESQQVRLRVQDDGQGFIAQPASTNIKSSTSSSFGLTGMQERSERMGGQLTITSQPGKGTEVVVQIPLLAS